jgi:transcription antitermination factor NusA-like protein
MSYSFLSQNITETPTPLFKMDDSENKRKLEESDDFGIEKKRQAMEKVTPVLAPITVSMDCPAASVGSIIGKKGANVHEIMKRSGCKIVIDQSDQRDGVPKRVNLTGPPDKLAVAMSLVSLIIKDGANALFGGDAEEGGEFKVAPLQSESRCPKNKVGEVIGVRGATIAEIMRRSGCKVHIIQEAPGDGSDERQVMYNGTIEQMCEAKALVQSVINEGASVLGITPAQKQTLTSNRYNFEIK